jgi:hypothetical protein
MIWILIVANIPVYLFLAWLAFDTKESAADTFLETTMAILKIIFIPTFVRYAMGMDDTNALGIVPIAGFFCACALLVYGEHQLYLKWF